MPTLLFLNVVTAFSQVVVRIRYLHIFTTLSLVFTALEDISYFSLPPSCIFEYTNQEYTSAEPEFVNV